MPPNSATTVLDQAHAALPETIHVGVLVPWANAIVEAELPRLGLDRVVFHYARLVPASRATALDHRFLRELTSAVPASLEEVSRLPLATTLLACTSAGFTEGEEVSLSVASAFDALVATLNRMLIDRIVLVAPYPHWLTAIEVRAFMGRGITVASQSSLNRDDGYSQVSRADIYRLLGQIGQTELARAQAIVLSCTGWPTLGLLAELEETFGMPVLSSNLAMAIHAMTRKGIGTVA
ncbi:MAG: aspartate/glutamate racemase family protein [Pseudonocardiaceae bacterium]